MRAANKGRRGENQLRNSFNPRRARCARRTMNNAIDTANLVASIHAARDARGELSDKVGLEIRTRFNPRRARCARRTRPTLRDRERISAFQSTPRAMRAANCRDANSRLLNALIAVFRERKISALVLC